MMKKGRAIFALLLMFSTAGLSEETGGSRGQINQSLMRGEDWKRIVTDTTAFALGKDTPYEADPALSIREWGTYPSMDGSTVCYYAVYEKGNETAARFAEWIVSKEGQACVAQAGYIPL